MMSTILFFFFFFYILTFLIEYNAYIIVCACIIIIGPPIWIVTYYVELNVGEIFFISIETIHDIISIMCFSILAPGLTLIVIQFIKRNTSKFDEHRIFGKYHVHEGFIGILFIVIAVIMWFIRISLIQYKIFRTTLRIFLAIDMIFLFIFLFFGSFLLFRDRKDVLQLNFFEKKVNPDKRNEKNNSTSVFSEITSESFHFFKILKVKIFPIGILLSSFSANALIHGLDLLPLEIFRLELETIVIIGIICCFIGAGIIGLDWYNLFAWIYPERYQEIENVMRKIQS